MKISLRYNLPDFEEKNVNYGPWWKHSKSHWATKQLRGIDKGQLTITLFINWIRLKEKIKKVLINFNVTFKG